MLRWPPAMVEFLSLFLSLVVGPGEVELAVGSGAAAVILELDGEAVGELRAPPWRLTVDFGDALRPHRLTARALDADGREIDSRTRLVNVYRPPVGAGFVLHRNASGWVTQIALSWPERLDARPRRSAVAVDGRPVAFDDPAKIYPPPLDPSRLHVVEAVVEYSDGFVARDRFGVGGPVLDESGAALTPIVIALADPRAEATAATFRARLKATGEPLRVVGVERADAELIFVRDGVAAEAVARIAPTPATMGALSGARDAQAARTLHALPLAEEEWVRILDPAVPVRDGRTLDDQALPVPLANDTPGGFGLLWHLKSVDPEAPPAEPGAWLADAVAIAAGRVAASGRRGATVLLLAPDSVDRGSLLDPQDARGFLDALGVPLRVWYLGKAAGAPESWGRVESIRGVPAMQRALEAVRVELGRQRVVWVEGVHLAGEVAIEGPSTSG